MAESEFGRLVSIRVLRRIGRWLYIIGAISLIGAFENWKYGVVTLILWLIAWKLGKYRKKTHGE